MGGEVEKICEEVGEEKEYDQNGSFLDLNFPSCADFLININVNMEEKVGTLQGGWLVVVLLIRLNFAA